MAHTIPLTRRGAEKLKDELQRLKSVERHAVIQAIAEARAQGDLSENAEYEAAKDKQGFIEGRILEIEGKLAAAQIIDPSTLDAGGRVEYSQLIPTEVPPSVPTVAQGRAPRQAPYFNYRGVNRSEGQYAHGEGELEDARAALGYLRGRFPDLPFTLAGFSFGSRIALRLGCQEAPARRVIAVGFPTAYKNNSYLEACTVPKIFIQSSRDQYGPLAELEPLVAALPEPRKLIVVEAGDHFFAGALEELEREVSRL